MAGKSETRRMKRLWRVDTAGHPVPLRQWARACAAHDDEERRDLCCGWLQMKGISHDLHR